MSPREKEIWGLAAAGMSDKAIAEKLYLAPRTVSNALTRVYDEVCGPSSAGTNRRVLAAVRFHEAAQRASAVKVGSDRPAVSRT